MTKKPLNYLLLLCLFCYSCQQEVKNIEAKERTIQVTGSADMSVIPDEIELSIRIEEYYSGSGKVSINKIEQDLISKLNGYGVDTKDIKMTDIGDYWHYPNDQMRLTKNLSIAIKDLSLLSKIVTSINVPGLDFIRISEMRHHQLQDFRKQVKSTALKAAKMKAEYLLESMNKSLGEVISIKELQDQDASTTQRYSWWYRDEPKQQLSNMSAWSGQSGGESGSGLQSIMLRYEMEVVFEIR